eukprot:762413-Hanusia_phi.AAC.8
MATTLSPTVANDTQEPGEDKRAGREWPMPMPMTTPAGSWTQELDSILSSDRERRETMSGDVV